MNINIGFFEMLGLLLGGVLMIWFGHTYRYNPDLDIYQPRVTNYTYQRTLMIEDPNPTMRELSKRNR